MAHAEMTEIAPGEVTARSPRRRSALASVEHFLGMLVEIPAAFLVVAEIVILFAGVVSRYVLHSPLIWSDELASILFLWLAMLGSAVAFRRAEHMRMTAIVASARPAMRAYLDMVATCAALAFLLMIVWPSYDYAYEESFITTPALQISNSWRAAALPVGICLMGLFAFLRLLRAGDVRTVLSAILSVAVVIAVFWLLKGTLKPLGNLNLIIFFVGVAGFCVFAGVPIAFGFGLATYGYLALTTRTPLMVLIGRMDEGMSHLILLSVPLFVFLGLLIEMTGMARAMVGFLASLLGHVRGGPPSLVLITIGSVTGVSIAALFTGGLLPGVVLAITLSALVWWRYRGENLEHVTKASGGEIARALVIALPALALPFVIRYAVVEGIATATEVSTIGIIYAFIVGFLIYGLLIYRKFEWRRIVPMLVETACLSGAILLIIGCATGMAWGLTQSGFSRALASAMTGLPGGSATFIAVSIVAFVVLGSVLEGIPAIVLFGPLLFPIARAVGVHEVHYAMIIILAMGIGLFAPPFGVGYYAACAIGKVDPAEGIRPIWGYLLALMVGLIIVAIFPWISIGFL